MKEHISIRLSDAQILAVKELSKETKQTFTKVIEVAINKFLMENPIDSEIVKLYIEQAKINDARESTKIEMRKCMFLTNSRKRFSKMVSEGITQKQTDKLIKVWIKEAEANGITQKEFLENLQRGIINEPKT